MITAITLPGNKAATLLTRFFGPGLADGDCHVVEQFSDR